MDISIIIVNYNTSKLTLDCLKTIKHNTIGISYEVIVVDNHSEASVELEILKSDKDIIYVQSKENLGFGRANNLGLRHANGEYILFLNSDTLLINNAIKMMYDFAVQYKGKLGALGTILEDKSCNKVHSYGKFPHVATNLIKLIIIPLKKLLNIHNDYNRLDIKEPIKVDYITGADLFVKKSVLKECHAFNPSFFMYSEETEMEHRFMDAGYVNILMTGPRIIHLEGESSANMGTSKFIRDNILQQNSDFIYFMLTESKWKYYCYRILLPIFRQILWLNPKVSLNDKITYMKTLFQRVTLKDFEDEHIG